MKKNNNEHAKSPLNLFKYVINLDNILSGVKRYSLKELADNFKEDIGSKATINRTINFMKDVLHAPILTDENHRYYYANNTFRLPVFFMNEEQMKACYFLKDYVKPLKGTPYYESINLLMELIQSNTLKSPVGRNYIQMYEEFDYHESPEMDWVNNHYIVLGDSRNEIEDTTWSRIERAIQKHNFVSFKYEWPRGTTMHQNPYVVKKVSPYQVVCSEKKWFLWGWNHDKDAFQLFWMDKIFGVELQREHFKLPAVFDYRKCSSGSWHLDILGCKVFKAKLLLKTNKTARELKEKFKTEYVKFSDNENGTVTAQVICSEGAANKIRVNILRKFECETEALEPEYFVKIWNTPEDELQQMEEYRIRT